MGSMALGSDNIGKALIHSSNLMMSICTVMSLSGVMLLFYSKLNLIFRLIGKQWSYLNQLCLNGLKSSCDNLFAFN